MRSVSDSPFVLGLQAEAKAHSIAINVGVHEPTVDGKKVKNTSLWIDEFGIIKQRYQKVHLFDVEIDGGPVLRESAGVEKGMSILPPFETAVGRVGLMVCFDVSLNFTLSLMHCKSPTAEISQAVFTDHQ